MNKIIIGITGGIASGKSKVADCFRQKNSTVIIADTIGHEILERPYIKEQLVKTFGKEILKDDHINRKILGKFVFQDKEKLQKLNTLVHPELIEEILKQVEQAKTKYVVIDAALLQQWHIDDLCDYVILVDAPREVRATRLQKYKGLTFQDAMDRILAQNPFSEDVDFVIKNNGSIDNLNKKMNYVWELITQ